MVASCSFRAICQDMENAETTVPVAKRSPNLRSKLGNGRKLLPLTDGRRPRLGGSRIWSRISVPISAVRIAYRKASASLSAGPPCSPPNVRGKRPCPHVARPSSTVSFTAPCAIGLAGCSGGLAFSVWRAMSARRWSSTCRPRLSRKRGLIDAVEVFG
jgi:hypothetical protein